MVLEILQFLGMAPRVDPTALDARMATLARDVDLSSGKVQPIETGKVVGTLSAANQKTIFPYNGRYLSWANDVNVQRGPVVADQYQRIYYTGDGVPKVRGIDPDTLEEKEYPLGVEKPAHKLTSVVQSKTASSVSFQWHYFYEEPDGTQKDAGDLNEGTANNEVHVVIPAKSFLLPTRPARVTASALSTFILVADAYDNAGGWLGRLWPNISFSAANSDMEIAGAKISGTQVNNSVTTTLVLTYDASRVADYTTNRNYRYTFVTAWGEEGAPSETSDDLAVDPAQDAYLSNFASPVNTPHNINRIRIYRLVTGTAGESYKFVAEVSLNAGSYLDELTDKETGAIISTTGYDPPPSDLTGLVAHPGGFFSGFPASDPKTIYFSVPYQPHAWKLDYAVSTYRGYNAVGLAVAGNIVYALTDGFPTAIYGDHPQTLSVVQVPLNQACLSKRGIAVEKNLVFYPSADGYCSISGGSGHVFTETWFTKTEWSELSPASMIAAVYDRRLHVFGGTTALVIPMDPRQALVETTETAQGVYCDILTDTLLMIQGASIVQWRGGTTRKTGYWRSMKLMTAKRWSPSVARLVADGYPMTLNIYADGVQVLSREVTSDVAFRIPVLRDEKFWQVETVGTHRTLELLMSDSMMALRGKSSGGSSKKVTAEGSVA